MVLGAGFWKRIPASHAVGVGLSMGAEGWNGESTFKVTWRDARKAAWTVNIDAHSLDRYKGTDKIAPIPAGSFVEVPVE